MKVSFHLVILLACFGIIRAEDWTVSGRTYHNVVVGQIEQDRVHITYDGGIGSVALINLSPDLQKKFGYDPSAAAAAAKAREIQSEASDQQAQDEVAFANALKKYVIVHGKLYPTDGHVYELYVKLQLAGAIAFSDGRVLGSGCVGLLYRPDYVMVQGAEGTIPKAVSMGMKETGEFIDLTWPLDNDKIQTLKLAKIGVSVSGRAIFSPVGSFTIDEWRKSGSPR